MIDGYCAGEMKLQWGIHVFCLGFRGDFFMERKVSLLRSLVALTFCSRQHVGMVVVPARQASFSLSDLFGASIRSNIRSRCRL